MTQREVVPCSLMNARVFLIDGKKSESGDLCLSQGERFKALFVGSQFVLGDTYFDKVGNASKSAFEHHVDKIKSAFNHGFRSVALKEKYTNTFSSANWEALPGTEKSQHSLSNCVACATQFEQLQESFPLKPFFRSPGPKSN